MQNNKTIKLTDGTTLPLTYKGTLNLMWENGDRLKLNEVYTAPGINDIIISTVNLIKRQELICTINKNNTYFYSERRENGNEYVLEHNSNIVHCTKCVLDRNTATMDQNIMAIDENMAANNARLRDNNESHYHSMVNDSYYRTGSNNNNMYYNVNEKYNKMVTENDGMRLIMENSEGNRKNAIIWHHRQGL